MKFNQVKTLEHFLKEYGSSTVGGGGHGSSAKSNQNKKTGTQFSAGNTGQVDSRTTPANLTPKMTKATDIKMGDFVFDPLTKLYNKVVSPVGSGEVPDALITQDNKNEYQIIKQTDNVQAVISKDTGTGTDSGAKPKQGMIKKALGNLGKGLGVAQKLVSSKKNEGKLSNIAKRKGKKLQVKDLKAKIKKLSRKRLKEADPKLFEINFNRRSVARDALDAPVRCGFEAETFWYGIEGTSTDYVDDMSISDVEYEYGDLPDSAYDYFNDWIREKAMDEYLPDLQDAWIEENRDEDEFIKDFMESGNGPTEDAVEEYKEQFEEEDPNEYENREEDGWDFDNWSRDLINEEYTFLSGNLGHSLPSGIIHADLFPDNIFFEGNEVTGIIDFYFACTDYYAYEIAICLNAWCFEPNNNEFNPTKAKHLLSSYNQLREFSEEEKKALPLLTRASSLRYLLTRLIDYYSHDDNELILKKDPNEYLTKLQFHQSVKKVGEYGL